MYACSNCGTVLSADTINFDEHGFAMCDYCMTDNCYGRFITIKYTIDTNVSAYSMLLNSNKEGCSVVKSFNN